MVALDDAAASRPRIGRPAGELHDRRPGARRAARARAAARAASRHGGRRGDRRRGQARRWPRSTRSMATNSGASRSAQFQELLKAEFGPHYLNCCRNTIEQETALGFEGRARMNSAAAVLRTAIAVLRRKHRFSPGTLADRINVLSQAIFFDLATTSTFYLQRVREASVGAAPGDRRGDRRVRRRDRRRDRRHQGGVRLADRDLVHRAAGDRRHAAPHGVGVHRPRRKRARASISPWPPPKSSRTRSRRSASRPRAAWKWRARRSPTPSAPTRPSARSTRRPSASARWSG